MAQIIVIMGVAGSGKSHIGEMLAQQLQYRFIEGDDFHPPENIKKMSAALALDDADRQPWLAALHQRLVEAHQTQESVVLAASLLKQSYRDQVFAGISVDLICLHGDKALLEQRMGERQHFMPASLLDSQLASLELPPSEMQLSLDAEPELICQQIQQLLGKASHDL